MLGLQALIFQYFVGISVPGLTCRSPSRMMIQWSKMNRSYPLFNVGALSGTGYYSLSYNSEQFGNVVTNPKGSLPTSPMLRLTCHLS